MRETHGRPFPLALTAPQGDVLPLTPAYVQQAILASRESPRKRIILPFHTGLEATLHRMLNAVQPGSYIRPHRHLHPPKAETVIVLQGRLRFVHFSSAGDILEAIEVGQGAAAFGLDAKPGVYHTFFALTPDLVVFEVKPGPYERASDKDFAAWAPEEGAAAATEYLQDLIAATGGPASTA